VRYDLPGKPSDTFAFYKAADGSENRFILQRNVEDFPKFSSQGVSGVYQVKLIGSDTVGNNSSQAVWNPATRTFFAGGPAHAHDLIQPRNTPRDKRLIALISIGYVQPVDSYGDFCRGQDFQ